MDRLPDQCCFHLINHKNGKSVGFTKNENHKMERKTTYAGLLIF